MCFSLTVGVTALVIEMFRAVLAIAAPDTAHSSLNMIAVMAGALLAGYALAYVNASLSSFLRDLGLRDAVECVIRRVQPECGVVSWPQFSRARSAVRVAPGHPRAPPQDD